MMKSQMLKQHPEKDEDFTKGDNFTPLPYAYMLYAYAHNFIFAACLLHPVWHPC